MKKILLLSTLLAFASCSSLGVEVKAQANTSYGGYTTSNNVKTGFFDGGFSIITYKNVATILSDIDVNLGIGLEGGKLKPITSTDEDFEGKIYLSPQASLEINKKINPDLKLHIGSNIGTLHVLKSKDISINKFSIKGSFGATYKNVFTSELSIGYPQYITIGAGLRIGL
jgi:hypothetical protein